MPGEVEVRESVIEGLGVFALRSFREGERIRCIRHEREITPQSPLQDGELLEHCSYPDGRTVLVGFPDRHVNHSCDPNCYKLYEDDSVSMVARRSISLGEELTFDYNLESVNGHRNTR